MNLTASVCVTLSHRPNNMFRWVRMHFDCVCIRMDNTHMQTRRVAGQWGANPMDTSDVAGSQRCASKAPAFNEYAHMCNSIANCAWPGRVPRSAPRNIRADGSWHTWTRVNYIRMPLDTYIHTYKCKRTHVHMRWRNVNMHKHLDVCHTQTLARTHTRTRTGEHMSVQRGQSLCISTCTNESISITRTCLLVNFRMIDAINFACMLLVSLLRWSDLIHRTMRSVIESWRHSHSGCTCIN